MRKTLFAGLLLILFGPVLLAQKNIKPIITSLDFQNKNNLWESVGNGIINFQANVMYIYGKNYVTSNMPDSANHKLPTLSDAYLYPLYNQYKKNNGEIIPDYQGDIFLILNFAYQPVQIYKQLAFEMKAFADMLSYKTGEIEHLGKLKILIRDKDALKKINESKPGFLGLVGNLGDVDKNIDSNQMPLIDVDLSELTNWKGTGNIPFEDFTKIKDLVARVHAQKKKISFNNCPAYKTVAELISATSADFVITNEPERMSIFFEPAK